MGISKLLSQKESRTLEFKESLRMKEEICAAVSGFSNASGGTVLVGVTDSGVVLGLDVGKKTTVDLAEYIKKNTDPGIFPDIRVHGVDGGKIISVVVRESHDKPVFFRRRAYKRVGDTTQGINSSEIRALAKESGPKVYWDGQVCEGAVLSDIDDEKVKSFVKEAKKQRNLNLPDTLSASETLMRLKLQKDEKPTNASVLMFAKRSADFFLQSETKCIRFKGTDVTGPMIDFKVMNEDIITQLKKIEDFIFDHIPMAAWIEDGKLQRQEKWLYPPKAIREALANALAHRDYETTSKVQVRIFDDRMEIWNPGRLPKGWGVEKLKAEHESEPFNPSIARQFFRIKYIEDVGSGTNKIVKWCKEWGLPEPDFKFTGSSIVVIFRKSRLTEEFLMEAGLNERQNEAIKYIKEHKKITSHTYAALFKITDRMARNDLNVLINKKIIEKRGLSDKTTHYILAEI